MDGKLLEDTIKIELPKINFYVTVFSTFSDCDSLYCIFSHKVLSVQYFLRTTQDEKLHFL